VLLGGILTEALGWPAIFAVNVPLGIIVIAAGRRVIPATTGASQARHFDVSGAMLVTASLVFITFGIVRTDTLGWGATGVLVPIAGGVLLFAAFLLVEARLARVPLVPLAILRAAGQLRGANLVVTLLYAAFFPVWFFLTLYLQQVLHYDPIDAGLAFLPMTLSIFAASKLAPLLVARFGPRPVVTAGMLTATVGMLLLRGIAPDDSYVSAVLPGALLSSIGMGCSLVPATIVAMQGLPRNLSGLGSGLLNTSRLMGGALGLAVLSTIAAAHTRAETTAGVARALSDGFDLAFVVGALFALAGAVAAATLLRPSAQAVEADVVAVSSLDEPPDERDVLPERIEDRRSRGLRAGRSQIRISGGSDGASGQGSRGDHSARRLANHSRGGDDGATSSRDATDDRDRAGYM